MVTQRTGDEGGGSVPIRAIDSLNTVAAVTTRTLPQFFFRLSSEEKVSRVSERRCELPALKLF